MTSQGSIPHPILPLTGDSPAGWLWSQHWLDVLFAHWQVAVADLRPHVPVALDIDTYEDAAWVSLVAFRLERIRRRWLPAVGFLTDALELNLRTYVRYQGEPAIFFLSIHANNRLVVRLARWATPLPYEFSQMYYSRCGDSIQFQSRHPTAAMGFTFTARLAPNAPGRAVEPSSLDDWLLERYCLYAQDEKGRLLRTVAQHPRWQVREATAHISANTMGQPFGLKLSRAPDKVHFADGVHAHLWPFTERKVVKRPAAAELARLE